MTYRLTASYAHGEDNEKLIAHYRDTHAKLGAKLPDVRSFTWGVCETPDGSKPAHVLVAVLEWDSKAAADAAFASQAGQDAVADLGNFAQAGVDLEFQEIRTEV